MDRKCKNCDKIEFKIPIITFSDFDNLNELERGRAINIRGIKRISKSQSAKQLTLYSKNSSNCHSDCGKNEIVENQNLYGGPISINMPNSGIINHLPLSPLITSHSADNNLLSSANNNNQHSILATRLKRNESNSSVTFPEELQISRRPSAYLQEMMSTRRPSAVMSALRPQKVHKLGSLHEDPNHQGSIGSLNSNGSFINFKTKNDNDKNSELARLSKRKNRRIGDDALSTALSTLYCKLLVIMGIALPVTDIISKKIPAFIYQGFYLYLYCGSILFVIFVYATTFKNRTLFKILKNYHEKANNVTIRRKAAHFGSFYLRVGAIAFGIGTMVYSGLEFGQYFEINKDPNCKDILKALTPCARMFLSMIQMQFIFLNTTDLDLARHKVVARFGLMHMVATNLCEWLYVLVEETRHEIHHFRHSSNFKSLSNQMLETSSTESNLSLMGVAESLTGPELNNNSINFNNTQNGTMSALHAAVDCERTNIMGRLVQDAAPFLFPCTIEYSLICAVILYEMWKKVKSISEIAKTRKDSIRPIGCTKRANHFSVDCSRSHRGLFFGILCIVMTIISMIMYFVLYEQPGYEAFALLEVTLCEIILYSLMTIGVIGAMIRMRDLKFLNKHKDSMSLDCTLLVLAQTGVFIYSMFSIFGSYFSLTEDFVIFAMEGLWAEILGLIQTSMQTLFILNACWRRCKGAQQQRSKPGRETITFLLIANVALWFINTLIKGRAAFRRSHLEFFGVWSWTIITHISMPLAIFYRFHSTICLFEIWKSAYKAKGI